jgi:aspartate ammonia-lyase
LHTGAAIPDLVVAQGLMSAERVAQLLAPDALLNPQSTVQPEEEPEA